MNILKSSAKPIEDCKYDNDFQLQLALVLAKRDSLFKEQFKEFTKSCSSKFSERSLDILHYPYKRGEDFKIIKDYLLSRGFSKKEVQSYRKIWNEKYNKPTELDSISKILKNLKDAKSELKKYRLYNLLIDISKKTDSFFMKKLLSSVSYGQIGNRSLFMKNFNDLLSINEIFYALDLNQRYISSKNLKKYLSIVNQLFSLLRNNIEDEELIRIFDSNFKFLDISKKVIKYQSSDLDWALNELRGKMVSYRYGLKFPAFWVRLIEGRTSTKEKNEFIRKIESKKLLKYLNPIDLWIFKHSFPVDEEQRVVLINSLLRSFDKNPLTRYVVLDLIEEPKIKKLLSKERKILGKPRFSLQRTYYHNNLHSGKESSLLIYKLLKMGEEREEFIWWLLL